MRHDLLLLVLSVGLATWAFRFVPTRLRPGDQRGEGPLSRLLAATGPAAIATLFVASILPMPSGGLAGQGALAAGILAVAAVYAASRSVVPATLAGAAAYGLASLWA